MESSPASDKVSISCRAVKGKHSDEMNRFKLPDWVASEASSHAGLGKTNPLSANSDLKSLTLHSSLFSNAAQKVTM